MAVTEWCVDLSGAATSCIWVISTADVWYKVYTTTRDAATNAAAASVATTARLPAVAAAPPKPIPIIVGPSGVPPFAPVLRPAAAYDGVFTTAKHKFAACRWLSEVLAGEKFLPQYKRAGPRACFKRAEKQATGQADNACFEPLNLMPNLAFVIAQMQALDGEHVR